MVNEARIEQLTGLRFFAALGVLLSHAHVLVPYLGPRFFFDLGGQGVTLFFVLSGFVLTWRYDAPAVASSQVNGFNARAYARARFARVAPLYWLALAMTVLAHMAAGSGIAMGPPPEDAAQRVVGLAINALALQAWIPNEHVQQFWNAPGWSISAEMFFYACFPWFLGRRWLSGTAVSFVGLMTAAAGALGFYLLALWAMDAWNPIGLAFAARWPLMGLPAFVMGMLCCRWMQRRKPAQHHGGWTCVALALLGACAWLVRELADGPTGLLTMLVAAQLLYVPLFALLVISLALDDGPLSRALRSGPLVLLGNASYALYLLHWMPIGAAHQWIGSAESLPLWAVGAGIVLLTGISVLVYQYFEKPTRLRLVGAAVPATRSLRHTG